MKYDLLKIDSLLSFGAVVPLYFIPSFFLIDAVISLFSDNLRGVIGSGGSYLLFVAAATLLRRGLANERQRRSRPSSVRRARPLKLTSASLIGMATAIAASLSADYSLLGSVAVGASALLGCLLLYGSDHELLMPMRSRTALPVDDLGTALRQAYSCLDRLNSMSKQLSDRVFRARCGNICNDVRNILALIEDSPAKYRVARRFLNVYLGESEKLISEYLRSSREVQESQLKQNFGDLLVEIERTCKEQYSKIQQDRVLDLDLQIEVLSNRLKHEGII